MPRKPSPDPLTIAYMAIGAMNVKRVAEDERLVRYDGGELEFIAKVIDRAELLDIIGADLGKHLTASWPYDVTQPFGAYIANALLTRDLPALNAIPSKAIQLVEDACR